MFFSYLTLCFIYITVLRETVKIESFYNTDNNKKKRANNPSNLKFSYYLVSDLTL